MRGVAEVPENLRRILGLPSWWQCSGAAAQQTGMFMGKRQLRAATFLSMENDEL